MDRAALPGGCSTPDGYFEAFCRVLARRNGAEIWGEKTPRHIFRLQEILTRSADKDTGAR